MHATRIDLPAKTRAKLERLLNESLADALDMELSTKQAHWNVKGPHFIALHELFDKLHTVIEGHVDELAERITALGGTAHGTARTVAKASSLSAYPEDIYEGPAHLEALSDRLAEFGKRMRVAITAADALEDADTADLYTSISRDVDQQLWFLEAHLQAKR